MNPYWFAPTIAIAAPLMIGPLGAYLGILRPDTGYMLFGLAVLLAFASAVLLPGLAAYGAATGKPWRRSALLGALAPVAVVLPVLVWVQLVDAAPIGEVSTDWQDPPVVALPSGTAPEPVDVRRARQEFLAEVQREAYPDLVPIELGLPPGAAYARALEAAREMPGWVIGDRDPSEGRIEAKATSGVFRFEADVVVRVRPLGDGSRVDVRSRPRQRRADFGTGARRLRAYASRLRRAALDGRR